MFNLIIILRKYMKIYKIHIDTVKLNLKTIKEIVKDVKEYLMLWFNLKYLL